ncbi:Cytochrome c/c1 heme lyase family protein [Theileria parva strain Muguga]|uniref:Holocytochrome c-type synthase n=1 Tax=Theileria parva TaxID=5875 RepID=Q4N7D4_THEPA|nr:Cytochrome c/c1 heme lyase family protein [Theileria parva strain Muguga]EAN34124.1 Cytochrome c/c1 heme lyase family protein [Theileria parva strain Muguga]|eukprot:XP_766407.1 cytochrome c1 heme lyase [Theileria parva strain Muguga]
MSCPSSNDTGSYCSSKNHVGPKFSADPVILSKLCSKRTKSSIPSRDSLWSYPSQQQFYKSTLNKGHNVDANLIPTIVEIHNIVNEKAWERVMEYESIYKETCNNPVLVHFVGNKDKHTFKSILNYITGYKLPFDRHDWTVDRCGNRRRYILEFYEGATDDPNKLGVYIDVRPDLSFNGICDRLRFWAHKSFSGV